MSVTLTAPVCEADPVRPVEREIGYRFRNTELLKGSTHTWHRLFGPLEHLGDAIADLVVGVNCYCAGLGPAQASRIVDNAHLELVLARRLRRVVKPHTGDVIEALIGAVHLDSDFDHAAQVTTRLLMPDRRWVPMPEVQPTALRAGEPTLVWLGALALDAVIADDLVRRRGAGRTSQRELSRRRSELVATVNLERVVRRSTQLPAQVVDARSFKAAIAQTMIDTGWSSTRELVVRLLCRSDQVPS
jgi:hypothetical protein